MMPKAESAAEQRTARLTAARQADSAGKRDRTLKAIERLLAAGSKMSYARIAREADVSTWLIYNVPDVRVAADAAIEQQRATHAASPQPSITRTASAESLRTDLALAREEVKALRVERDRLRERLRKTLGAEIDQTSREELITRIQRLEDNLREVVEERDTARAEANTLRPLVHELRERIEAQQDLNRDLMRQVNSAR